MASRNMGPKEENEVITLRDRWERVELIDEGAFGQVYCCSGDNGGLRVALKIIRCSGCDVKCLEREVDVLRHLKDHPHPNIVTYRGHFKNGDKLYLELDYIDGVNLRKTVLEWGKKDAKWSYPADRPPLVKKWFYQLFSALRHLHQAAIIHRDIKPGNLVVEHSTNNLFVVDFGISKNESEERTEVRGTEWYISPESLSGNVTVATDVWSAAVTFAALLQGQLNGVVAKDENFRAEVVRRVSNCLFATEEVIQSVVWILSGVKVEKRPTAEAVLNFIRPNFTAAELPEERYPSGSVDTLIESCTGGDNVAMIDEGVGQTTVDVGGIGHTVVMEEESQSGPFAFDDANAATAIVNLPTSEEPFNSIDNLETPDNGLLNPPDAVANHGSEVSELPLNGWETVCAAEDINESTIVDLNLPKIGNVTDDAVKAALDNVPAVEAPRRAVSVDTAPPAEAPRREVSVDTAAPAEAPRRAISVDAAPPAEAPRRVVAEQTTTSVRSHESPAFGAVAGPLWIMSLSEVNDRYVALLLLARLGFQDSFYEDMKTYYPIDGDTLMGIRSVSHLCQVIGDKRMPPSGLICDGILKKLRVLQNRGIERGEYLALEKETREKNAAIERSEQMLRILCGVVVLLVAIVAVVVSVLRIRVERW